MADMAEHDMKQENDGPYDPFADTIPSEDGDKQPSPNDNYHERSRSRSPIRRSHSRSRSPRDWKRNERGDKGHDRDDRDRNRDRRGGGNISRRIYISNIPYELRWQDVKDLFRKQVGEVTYVELYETPDGKPTGAGIIEFKDVETASKAVTTMNKYEVKSRKLVVREERDSDRRRHAREHNRPMRNAGGGGGGGGRDSDGGRGMLDMGFGMSNNSGPMGGSGSMGGIGGSSIANTYGISPQILQQLGIEGPVTDQVFVANLDYQVSEKKLKEIFKMAGNVVKAELKMDKNGKSRGMGIIQFESPIEAVQAISMFHGQILFERSMSVRMDKMADQNASSIPSKLPSGLKTIGMGLGVNGAPLTGMNQLQSLLSNTMGNMGSSNMSNMGSNMGGSMGNMGGGMGNLGGGMGGMSNMGGMGGMGSTGMANMLSSGMGGMGGMGSGSSSMGGMGGMGGSGFGDGMLGSGTGIGMGNMGGTMGMGSTGSSMDSLGMRNSMDSMGGLGSMGGSTGLGGMGMGSSIGGMGLMGMGSNTTSSSSMMRSSSRDLDTTVFVRNLPFTYTWQNLKEKFRHIGDVKYAAIRMENNRSKGCGVVRFTSPDEARRAINMMNGARIEGREIEVRMDSH